MHFFIHLLQFLFGTLFLFRPLFFIFLVALIIVVFKVSKAAAKILVAVGIIMLLLACVSHGRGDFGRSGNIGDNHYVHHR